MVARLMIAVLKVVLRHKFVTLLVSFAVIGLTFYLTSLSKTGFIPDEDQGLVFAFTEAQQGRRIPGHVKLQQTSRPTSCARSQCAEHHVIDRSAHLIRDASSFA